MILDERRGMVLRFASLAALTYGALLLLQISTFRLADANVTSDSFQGALVSIGNHSVVFALSAGLGALAVACLVPMMVGVWETSEPDEQPFAAMICILLLISGVLLVDAYAHLGNLVGVAADYKRAVAPRDWIVLQGDNLGDQFQILQYAGLVAQGIALLIWSWLMARSALYPKPMSWLTWGFGLLCFASVIQPAPMTAMIAVRLVWASSLGIVWLRATTPRELAENESVST
jgi:tellurite resistance protein TehA-like permease